MSEGALPENEPTLSYAPGTPERQAIRAELARQSALEVTVPLRIGGEAVETREQRAVYCPHRHTLALGRHSLAGESEVARAITAATAARWEWASTDFASRARIFLKAAELARGPFRQRLNAATMLNQSKTVHQAEIDAACELVDFFRFNVHFAERLAELQPTSPPGIKNSLELRPLDGFVYAVTPFNFTSIAGNLPSAPALMGNTVIWKPSPYAVLSAHVILELLTEAGLPGGVINLVLGDAEAITRQVLGDAGFAGLHYTGSTAVFQSLWRQISDNLTRYGSYPRIVAETGGKDFVIAHPSADVEALAVALVRGAYEFQGQKCSAVSRVYVARSLWPALEARMCALISELRVGDPADFRNFMGAVIARHAFDRIVRFRDLAAQDPSCRMLMKGSAADEIGFFVGPTLVEVSDPRHLLMREEIFGPLASVWVYDDDRYEEALRVCDGTSPYALTGAVFARDPAAITLAERALRFSAGNFYVNDKPTGAVVGQQPFGGSRWSGTNDKAGAPFNLLRWTSPRTVKVNLDPPRDYRYPFMQGD